MLSDTIQWPSAHQAERLGTIVRAGRHPLELISDLVDLAKIGTGRLGLYMAAVTLAPLVRECFALFSPRAQKRSIPRGFDRPDIACVTADRLRVKQVLLNLLSNPVKHNREQGSVTVGFVQGEARWPVSLRDTGNSMAPADHAEWVQPFSRLGQTAEKTEGTGIGLSLSENLIKRMGGQIGVISHSAPGGEFWFELPDAHDPLVGKVKP